MNNLDISQFSPQKAELLTIVERYKGLTINGVDDQAGYKMVDEARKDLAKKRVYISKTAKDLRSEAIAFQKSVIELEKELVGIIEPLELEFKNQTAAIDQEKLRLKRIALLPERQEKLKAIGVQVLDRDLLDMTDEDFTVFYNQEHTKVLEAKAKAIAEEEARIQREKELEAEREKARQEQIIKDEEEAKRKEAAHKAELEATRLRIEKEKEESLEKAEKEKQALIDAHAREKEEARLKAERDQKEAEQKELELKAAAQAEEERVNKMKAYQAFLSKNNYTEDGGFKIEKTADSVLLYKLIDTFKI